MKLILRPALFLLAFVFVFSALPVASFSQEEGRPHSDPRQGVEEGRPDDRRDDFRRDNDKREEVTRARELGRDEDLSRRNNAEVHDASQLDNEIKADQIKKENVVDQRRSQTFSSDQRHDASIPNDVHETLSRIDRGERSPYQKDGTVFENRENRLPQHKEGYYKEYTVPTSGADSRGERRLVIGEGKEAYYTHDHYKTFQRVR